MNKVDQSILIDGYCFELAESFSAHWVLAGKEEWEIVMRSRIRATRELGQKHIDGRTCLVFECDDGRIRAVVMTAAAHRRRQPEASHAVE